MTMSELPRELVEEILCHVPATDLKRVRSTCRRWNRLYKNKSFVKKHCDKATKQLLVLMVVKECRIRPVSFNLNGIVPSVEIKNELSLVDSNSSSLQLCIDQAIHCDGLLLCNTPDGSRIVVWNPLTGQTRWFDSKERYKKGYRFSLGYYQDSKSSHRRYKVLCFYRGIFYDASSEIYEFHSDSWRRLDDDIAPRSTFLYSRNIWSLKGNTYWLSKDTAKPHLGLFLLKFDYSTEKFGTMALPYQRPSYDTACISVVREEKLSVLLQLEALSKTEIWVTNKIDDKTQVFSWTKVLALDLSIDLQISNLGSFLLDEEKKILIYYDRWFDLNEETTNPKDMIYMVGEDNKVTQFDLGEDMYDGSCPAFLNYVPSLVQIKQASGKRKRTELN